MTRRGGITAIDGAMALIAILLIIQMWLLTTTLEAFDAHGIRIPFRQLDITIKGQNLTPP